MLIPGDTINLSYATSPALVFNIFFSPSSPVTSACLNSIPYFSASFVSGIVISEIFLNPKITSLLIAHDTCSAFLSIRITFIDGFKSFKYLAAVAPP